MYNSFLYLNVIDIYLHPNGLTRFFFDDCTESPGCYNKSTNKISNELRDPKLGLSVVGSDPLGMLSTLVKVPIFILCSCLFFRDENVV